MTLSIVQKSIKFADGTTGPASFATDGINYWPVSVLANESGALITDSAGLIVSVTTGSPGGALGNASFAKATDGTNIAAVKAASAPAAATDPALVVAVSPNTSPAVATSRSGFLQGTCSAAVAASVGTIGGWVPGNSITLDATGAGVTTSAVLQVATTQVIGTPTIAAAGAFTGTTGVYNIQGTTGTGTRFYAQCTLTNGSGVTAVIGIVSGGSYTVNPTTLTAEPMTATGLTGATLSIKMGIGALTVTSGGAYAPTAATQVTNILATAAPLSTTGAGSLTGVTITPAFSGVATLVAATNAARKALFFQNISGSNIGYSFFTTTPIIGAPGTETLAPGASYEKDGFTLPNQALYAIGAAFAAYSGREI